VTGSVSSHPGYATLSLQTRGSIKQANGATLAVANLALQAGSGIGTTGDLLTTVTYLAFANTKGAIRISNTGAVTLTSVDTVIGSSIPGDIYSSSVVGSVYTLLHSSAGVSGLISYNGRALAEGATLVLADGNRYQISYKANGGQDVTLTRIANASSNGADESTPPAALGATSGAHQVNLETPTGALPHGRKNKVFEHYGIHATHRARRRHLSDSLGRTAQIERRRARVAESPGSARVADNQPLPAVTHRPLSKTPAASRTARAPEP
jgi:hypothetical protein